jgi:hypothetical protein
LRVTVQGDPHRVNICNCGSCQRRSGSAFQIGAWFTDSQVVSIEGDSRRYLRPAKEGRSVVLEFCPVCGVSVIFRADVRPGWTGLHGGCFADPDFPPPTHALYTANACRWVVMPPVEHSYDGDD